MRISNPDKSFARYRRSGDPSALARVFDRLAPELLAVARHLVPDAAEAEDVVQATFLAAIERAGSFDPERSVRPWLMGILSRQAGLARRRAQRTPEPELLPEKTVDDPASAAQRAELRTAVERALSSVPAPYSQVLALHLSEEQRPEEIAAQLGRRPGTVRVQLHRGLRLLRRALPAGLTAGLTLSLRAPRGLGAIKSEVLRHAASYPVAAGAVPVLGGIGVLTMSKAGIFSTAAVAMASVAYFAWPEDDTGAAQGGREARVARRAPVAAPIGQQVAQAGDATPTAPAPTALHEREALAAPPSEAGSAPAGGQETAVYSGPLYEVSGKVVDSLTGDAVVGARVTFWLEEDAAGERPSLVTSSSGTGSFSVAEAPGVPVSMTISAADYAPHHGQPFRTLDTARASSKLELGEVQLERGVRVTGRVIDARTRGGVADVMVFQYMSLQEGLPRQKLGYGWRVARTDDDGRFEVRQRLPFTGVHPHEHGFLAAGAEGLGWASFEALQGGESEHELLIELERGVPVTVTVLDEDGRPRPDAWVSVEPLFDPFAFLHEFEARYWHGSSDNQATPFSGNTDAAGRITLHVPLPRNQEEARVRIEAGHGGPWRALELLLDPAVENLVTLGVEEDSLLTISGRVMDENGRGIEGATVSGPGDYALTDSLRGGDFELYLEEHEVDSVLTAEAEGFGRASVRYDSTHGFPVRGVDIVLRPAAPIAGIVVDPDGNAVPGSHVSISERAADGTFAGNAMQANVDAEARFRFDHATAGSWLLHASPPYGDANWAGVESQVVKAGSEQLRIVLKRSAPGVTRVQVDVFEAETGLPLDPDLIHVTARAEPGELATFPAHTEQKRVAGGVVLENVKPGPWRLWVKAARGVAGHVDFDVAPGEASKELRLELGGTAGLRGRVEGLAADAPYTGHVSVMLSQANGTPRWQGWGDEGAMSGHAQPAASGVFTLADLLPGTYRVHYVGPGIVAYADVEALPGRETDFVLRPVPSATIHVRGPEPSDPGHIRLSLRATDGGWDTLVNYGQRKDGTFASSFFVPAGTFEWEASYLQDGAPRSEPPRSARGRVGVAAGDVAEVWAPIPR